MIRRPAAILVLLFLLGGPAYAQDTTPGENLGGYDSAAIANAVSFQPFLPALVSTGDVPFEVSFAHSTSRVKSGGNALGRGALVWPGSTAADMGPVLGAAFGQDELGSLLPKWPLQASANQDSGEVVTGAPPIASMRAVGHPDRAEGDARIADIDVSRLVHIEHIASTSSSVVTDQSVTSTARVTLHGVTLLGGFVKAETIRSISRTTSIGGSASSSGDVDVIGLEIGGVEVSVTDDGFHVTGLPPGSESAPGAGEDPFPNQSPEEVVNSVLESLGARITLFESFSNVSGGQAERLQPGLVISLDNPVGGQGPIPPGRFDIFLASTGSSALSTLPFSADLGETDTDGVTQVAAGGASRDGGSSISLGPGPEVAGETLTDVGRGLSDAAAGDLGAIGEGLGGLIPQRSDYRFDGLPIGMVLGLLLGAALAARYVRNFFRSMIAPAGGPGDAEEAP